MKKAIAMVWLCILFGVTACGNTAEQTDLEEVSVVLDWYPNAMHAFLYVAEEKGYFAEEGLEIALQFPANTNDGIALPAAGKADLGMYYLQDVILTAVEEEVPIVSVGAVVQESLDVVISLEEKGIQTPMDLKGKKIGYAGTALSEAKIACMLAQAGLSAEDCELIDVGFDLLTALTTKRVDATIGNMVNHEVPQLKEKGIAIQYFSPTEFGVPSYYELVFVAGRDTLEENPEKIRKFLRAAQKGFAFVKENPQEAIQILLEHQNKEHFPLSASVEQMSIETLLQKMETAQAPFFQQDTAVWQENADWLYEMGMLQEQTEVSFLVENLFEN